MEGLCEGRVRTLAGLTFVAAFLGNSVAATLAMSPPGASMGELSWGLGSFGELGNGTTTDAQQTTPVSVSLPSGVTPTAIAGAVATGFAIGSDGNLYAWGFGGNGELGNGTTTDNRPPRARSRCPTG